MKEKIRSVYSELQGLLSQCPPNDGKHDKLFDSYIPINYESTLRELGAITGEDYTRYKAHALEGWNDYRRGVFDIAELRTQLGSLISRLHGKYFSDETPPFGGTPSTVITTHQTQNQSVQIHIAIELAGLVERKLMEAKEGSKEKEFLTELKKKVGEMKDIGSSWATLLGLAHQAGLALPELLKIFQ